MTAHPSSHTKPNNVSSAPQLMLWETDVKTDGIGGATLTARKPLSSCNARRACMILGLPMGKDDAQKSLWTLRRLAKLGMVVAWKPGMVKKRKDGKRSNAKQVYDVESLLRHKERSMEIDG